MSIRVKIGAQKLPLFVEKTILAMGYQQCVLDQCLFYYKGNGELNLILVYVDDIIVRSADNSHIEMVSPFKFQYAMQDMGDLEHYFGIAIVSDKNVINLHQIAYAQDVVSRYSHLLSDKKG